MLISEGSHICMRQKKMTPDLKEIEIDVLSSKGTKLVAISAKDGEELSAIELESIT